MQLFEVGGCGYRYGFNGKEKDPEGLGGGGGSTYDYGFRIYNPQIAKFLSVDPLTSSFAYYTPYQFAGNKPIVAIDLDGLEELIMITHHTPSGVQTSTVNWTDIEGNVGTHGPLGTGTASWDQIIDEEASDGVHRWNFSYEES